MAFLDSLGAVGEGVVAGTGKLNQMYGQFDRNDLSRVAADRAQLGLQADRDANVFGLDSQYEAAKRMQQIEESQLGQQLAGDKRQAAILAPQVRSALSDAAVKLGVGTPEFNREAVNTLLKFNMVKEAGQLDSVFRKEALIRQHVAKTVRTMPEFANVSDVQIGQDGQLYGVTIDPSGQRVMVDLPKGATRQYAALTGNTKLLGYDLRERKAGIENQAIAQGNIPEVRQPTQRTTTDSLKVLKAFNDDVADLVKRGLDEAQATKQVAAQYAQFGIVVPGITQPTNTTRSPGSVARAAAQNRPTATTRPVVPTARSGGASGGWSTPSVSGQIPVSPEDGYGFNVDGLGNPIYYAP